MPAACRAAMLPRVSAPFLKPGCTPGDHQRVHVPHHDSWAMPGSLLVQRETGVDVTMLLVQCAWEKNATPPRALPSTQSFRIEFSRRP